MFSKQTRKQIFKIMARSIKRQCEIAGAMDKFGRIISAVDGNRQNVKLPYSKKYDIYYHTHPSDPISYEPLCLFHKTMPPSGQDLFVHVNTSRSHITEYIFTEIGVYKITNPNFNTVDWKILQSLRVYYTFMIGLYYLRDNVYVTDDGPYNKKDLMDDILVLLSSINMINLDLIPKSDTLFGKALGLFIDREFPRHDRQFQLNELIDCLKKFHGKKIVYVEFQFWR